MVVEMACTGTFRNPHTISSAPSTPPSPPLTGGPAAPTSGGISLSLPNVQNIYPIIVSVVHPQPLHTCLLPCAKTNDPESTVSISKFFFFFFFEQQQISLLSTSLLETDPTISATSTRHNSFSEEDSESYTLSPSTSGPAITTTPPAHSMVSNASMGNLVGAVPRERGLGGVCIFYVASQNLWCLTS